MNTHKAIMIAGILLTISFIVMWCSSLHNVDLVFNAKHLDMEDDNGITVQDLKPMYQRSMLQLWILPIFMMISIGMIWTGASKWR